MWIVIRPQNCTVYYELPTMNNAGFPYRLDRRKHRASKLRGSPAKIFLFNTVIGLSHLCCHNILYCQNNPSRILQHFKHPSSSLPLLKLIKHASTFLQSWRWGIGRGLTNGLAQGLSLSKSDTDYEEFGFISDRDLGQILQIISFVNVNSMVDYIFNHHIWLKISVCLHTCRVGSY